jgi:hypothetical protein
MLFVSQWLNNLEWKMKETSAVLSPKRLVIFILAFRSTNVTLVNSPLTFKLGEESSFLLPSIQVFVVWFSAQTITL